MNTARLVLEDGTIFVGQSFGARSSAAGEVVFNTAMTGYTESLSDPSYAGQILTMTWPLVGNYGVPPHILENGFLRFFESEKIWAKALIVSEYSESYSHWNAVESLAQWLTREGIPAISGVDTRALTKRLREKGTMLGRIILEGEPEPDLYDPGKQNLIALCSCSDVSEFSSQDDKNLLPQAKNYLVKNRKPRIILVDCGAKNNILRSLVNRNAVVVRVPWNYDYSDLDFDGVMLSNGPGDPNWATETVEVLRKVFEKNKPIFGICMGNQILAQAAGATTFRLRYGHRGHNQPVILPGTTQTWITSQNHGYAVDPLRLHEDWTTSYINLNDGTCEGIRHKTKPFFSVQFHPEACGGPRDAGVLFDQFLTMICGG
ncbi:MAG: glutamine-hydrolyzing carbamoyl-phosphate synthase small subunit [Planctomycetia bacterium]|nr:glutamine-hydrolyzing carbamoyl-phosphate synthase small subunit [Planctomycetia bacterium]